MSNIERIKRTARVVFGAISVAQHIYNRLNPIVIVNTNEFGVEVTTTTSVTSNHGGVILTAGLVIYCVALVFHYGISLQKQADETL